MNSGSCRACGEQLPSWSRSDRRTCSSACRTRLWRSRQRAGDACVTGTRLAGRRSGRLARMWPRAKIMAAVAGLARVHSRPGDRGHRASP
jgi:hypothetical protein